jgi:hypothetical protein
VSDAGQQQEKEKKFNFFFAAFFFAAFRAASFFALAPRAETAAFFFAAFFAVAFVAVFLVAFFATIGRRPLVFFSGGVPGINLPSSLCFSSANAS